MVNDQCNDTVSMPSSGKGSGLLKDWKSKLRRQQKRVLSLCDESPICRCSGELYDEPWGLLFKSMKRRLMVPPKDKLLYIWRADCLATEGEALVQRSSIGDAQPTWFKPAGLPACTVLPSQQFGEQKINELRCIMLSMRLPPPQEAEPQRPVGAQRPARRRLHGWWESANTGRLLKRAQAVESGIHVAMVASVVKSWEVARVNGNTGTIVIK